MKLKKVAIISLLVVVMSVLVGCGYKDISVIDLGDELVSITDSSKYEKGDGKTLKRYYGLNSNDYEEVSIYVPSSNMEASELLIIKMKDESQIDTIEASVDSRIEKQSSGFKDYAPEQYGLVQSYEFSIKGNYAFFAISEDAHEMKKQFKDAIK